MRCFPQFAGLAGWSLVGLLAATGCDCPKADPPPPQFRLAFSTDTLASGGLGFRRAEVRSAYLVRYSTADFQSLVDTLRQPTPATAKSSKPVLGIYYYDAANPHPPQFAVPDYVSQNNFARSFRLVVPAANRTFDITNVVIQQAAGSGRCALSHTTRNEATVNGQVRNGLSNIPELTK